MTGFEPGSSGIGNNRSANCATTTAQIGFVCLRWHKNCFEDMGEAKVWTNIINVNLFCKWPFPGLVSFICLLGVEYKVHIWQKK